MQMLLFSKAAISILLYKLMSCTGIHVGEQKAKVSLAGKWDGI